MAIYDEKDALGLAELVQRKEASAAELLEEAIARAEKVNPKIGAIIRPLYERARKQAQAPVAGPFSGVPFLLKDLMQVIPGVPTESGSRFYKGYVPPVETTLFGRYEAAGLVTFGKTNTPEFGLLPVTEPDTQEPTRNPWDLSRTCGGSSGGAGAAVSAGIVPMAHGGDGGGSIRIPAACGGIFGLKPTRGRTPAGPRTENWGGFAIEHVLTRSVRDSAAALDAVAGVEDHAPYHPPFHEGTFLKEVGADPGKLRIGWTTEPPLPADVHPDCVAATEHAARLLEELGHEVVPIQPGFSPRDFARAFVLVVGSSTAAAIRLAERNLGKKAQRSDFETTTWLSAMIGDAFSAAELALAKETLQEEVRRFVLRMRGFDVLLTPTLGQPPLEVGALTPPWAERKAQELIVRSGAKALLRSDALMDRTIEQVFQFTAFTPLANVSGQPSMSVPLYWNADGLPIGSMLTGRFGEDGRLLRLAAQLEQARPWAERRAPYHVTNR